MEVAEQQNLRGDQMSDCRSFGSNYRPSSQSRKVSIGIMVDSLAKKFRKEDGIAMPNTELLNAQAKLKHKDKDLTTAIKGKQAEAHRQVLSPWVTTRSFHQKIPTSETVLSMKQPSSSPGACERPKNLNGVKHAPLTYSLKLFANQTSVLLSSDGKQDKDNGITNKMKGGKERILEKVEEFTFATAQEVLVSQKAVNVIKDNTDMTENRSTEALRMKLLEILGTVSSPKSQHRNSQDHNKVGASNLDSAQVVDQKKNLKPRQNSDTIETDSGSPVPAVRRPVTRSLSHKRAASKVPPSKSKLGSSSNYKERQQEKNIFSFHKESQRSPWKLDNADSTRSKRKESQRKDTFKGRTLCLTEEDGADCIQKENCRQETPPTTEKISSLSNKTGNHNVIPPVDNSDFQEPQNTILERDSNKSSVRDKENQPSDLDSPTLAERSHQKENIANTSFKKFMDLEDAFHSPTFGIKAPKSIPSSTSMAETVQIEQCDPSLASEERIFSFEKMNSFRTFQTSKPFYFESSPQIELADDLEKFQDYAAKKQTPVLLQRGTEDGLSESSSGEELQDDLQKFPDYAARREMPVKSKESPEDSLSESSSEEEGDSDSSKEGQRERETFLGDCTTEKSKSMHSPTKRVSDCKRIRINKLSPHLPSPDGVQENDHLAEFSEQNQEDDLGRAVTLLALALKNFERKLASAAKKKSSEILISVSDGIKLQLQNFESQSQTDLEKLTSLSITKRKHMETRFQEQEEQFMLLHEKFKEDINHHIQDCRSTIKGLEMQQIELKGTQKKQKTSHKKLISQVEEAVQSQLDDAQRRITAVNELARGKMVQLKRLVGECLKEGILN